MRKDKLTEINCEKCGKEVVAMDACLTLKQLVGTNGFKCTNHYHIPSCCSQFQQQSGEVSEAIEWSSYREQHKN